MTAKGILLALLLLPSLAVLGWAEGPAEKTPRAVAKVGNTLLSEDQMRKALGPRLFEAENYIYQNEKNWVDQQAQEILFDQAAKQAGLSRKEWEARELDAHVVPPTSRDVEQLMRQSGQLAVSTATAQYTAAYNAAQANLIDQRKFQRRREIYQGLLTKNPHAVELFIQRPVAPRVDVSYSPADPLKGRPSAPVTILEFTDFQCPFCKRSQDALREVEKAYPETVKLVTRQFPLSFHNRARAAAEAALCAQEQGKYWEYRDKLFDRQQLSDEDFKRYTRELKMNARQFDRCLTEHRYAARIDADIRDGGRYGVSGTPTFFVNGQSLSGSQPFEVFRQAIQDALAEKPVKN